MRYLRHFLVLIVANILAAVSCQQAPFLSMTGPRAFTFTRDGGSQSFSFTCNRDWNVSSTESWVTLSPSSGAAADGEIIVKITCAPNTTYDARTATVTVKLDELSESITITQDTGIGLIVSPTTFELTNASQDIEIEVKKNIQYNIAIDDAGIDWIKVGGTKALSTDKVTFHIAQNTDYSVREGRITFKQIDGPLAQTIIIRQDETNGLFVTTPTYDLSNSAHTLSVEVKANVEFEVTSQADWIKLVETKALKTSTVVLAIDANESYDNRTGTVLVKQKNGELTGAITVNQKQTDGLIVTPSSFELTNQEQYIEMTVKQNVAYSIVIPDEAKSWVSIPTKVQTKALIDDKVILQVAQNSSYDDRETSITLKQTDGPLAQTVKIKQDHGEGLIVDTKTYEIGHDGGYVEVEVMSNVEYEVECNATWVHYIQTKTLTKSTVELSVDENAGDTIREATVTIKQRNGELCVTVKIIQDAGEEEPQETGPFFSKGVELMCLIWRLAGAPEYNLCEVSKVNKSVDEYFSTMLDHEAVLLAKDYMTQNICYDAVTSYGLHLVINKNGNISFNPDYLEYDADGFFYRWSPLQRERMLKAVNDFYKESRFEEWFHALKPLFSEAKIAFEKVCNVDYTWYDNFFGTIENHSRQIILSFLIGPHNNGLSVLLKGGGIMSSPVMGCAFERPSGELGYGSILDVIIHEFCHPYCNPLISKYWNAMEKKALEVYKNVQVEMESQAYGSPMTMMCETFVRSSVIRYFLSHFSDYSRNELVNQQDILGFKLVGTFVDALELREKNPNIYPTMDEFMPELIKAMDNYVVDTYSGYYPEYNNPSSPNLLPGLFTVGPNSYVQFTKSNVYWNGTELKFEDNPMNYRDTCKLPWHNVT